MTHLWTRRLCTRALATASLPLATAAFVYWVQINSGISTTASTSSHNVKLEIIEVDQISSAPLAYSSSGDGSDCNSTLRLRQTPADLFFAKHQELPKPAVMHAILPVQTRKLVEESSKNILVIGDVHGCFDELLELHKKAIQEENDGRPFQFVILVGDLCNKGPQSAKVLRWVRSMDNWFSVRGNHEDGALAAALGDKERRKKKKYKWVMDGEDENHVRSKKDQEVTLSDEDVIWLSELPYSLSIPGSYLGEDTDTLIVHAGLIPDLVLETQEIDTMTTMREVLPMCDAKGNVAQLVFHEREKHNVAELHDTMACNIPLPWASVWKGPQRIIFGHDAKRGLQRYEGDWAIGLDSGAVYGRQMTGIILPERKLVSIKTKEQ